MKSLRAFFREEKRKRDEALAKKPQSIEDDADFERISKINDEWNHQVAKVREARLKSERIAMQEEIKWQLEQQREYEEEQRRITNDLVLQEKVLYSVSLMEYSPFIVICYNFSKFCKQFQEAAKSFIVRENFDEALELALKEKTDFNYAINLKGEIYLGRTGKVKQDAIESK